MDTDLDQLARLHARTSPGPWARVGAHVYAADDDAAPVVRAVARGPRQHHDAAFIAAAHAALPALLDELQALRAEARA